MVYLFIPKEYKTKVRMRRRPKKLYCPWKVSDLFIRDTAGDFRVKERGNKNILRA